jgi:hypothetical protein
MELQYFQGIESLRFVDNARYARTIQPGYFIYWEIIMVQTVRSRKIGKRELELLKQIIVIMLSGKGSCVHSVSDGFVYSLIDGPQHFAVERLIREFGSHQGLAALAVNEYLDRFQQGGALPLIMSDFDALDYAYRIAEQFSIPNELGERLLHCIAEAGWYGRLENCARKYCNRTPTPEEVELLFKNYMSSASQSDSTDKKLAEYANKYMLAPQAQEQMRLLAERNDEFHSSLY